MSTASAPDVSRVGEEPTGETSTVELDTGAPAAASANVEWMGRYEPARPRVHRPRCDRLDGRTPTVD